MSNMVTCREYSDGSRHRVLKVRTNKRLVANANLVDLHCALNSPAAAFYDVNPDDVTYGRANAV